MKKIININLSGRVIPIEDSAYEKLQAYIESLRRYFSNEDGRDEIINDIESRLAELMNDKVRKGASHITDADLDEIIASMGRPEDFDAETADTADAGHGSSQQSSAPFTSERKSRGRLYRDSSDKFIGGVCSGLANYLNTDPAIVRILFAIITFGGFGLGFLIYILMWMILPTKDLDNYSGKRLYRNPDDRVFAGVAGGLAAYFNIKTSTLRLIFAAPLILSILISILDWNSWDYGFNVFPNIVFGSLSGTFILAYVVLWIVLPEARSTYEKMEMRGEKVDVNSIRQNVKEGMDNMKDRVKTWSDEVKESATSLGNRAKDFANTRGKTFAAEVKETTRSTGGGIGYAIGIIFKVFFLFIAGTIAFGLFVGLMALLFGGIAWWPINNFLWTSKWQQLYAWGTLIFFLIVPLVGFIIWVVRRVMRVRSRSSYLGWTFGALWAIGWVSAVLLASSITHDFREYEHVDSAVTIEQPSTGRMIVAVTQPELAYTGSFGWMDDDGDGWDLSSDTLKLSMVKFNIEKSIDSHYHVIMRRFSYGRNPDEAMRRAEKLEYVIESRDSILDLASGYAVDRASKFRFQQVEVEIQVPVGKKIRFDHSVDQKLNPVNMRAERSGRRNRSVRIDWDNDYWNHYRSNTDYVMGDDGDLVDPAGKKAVPASTTPGQYRYNDNSTDTLEIKRQLEIERIKNEEKDRRIRELEKNQETKPSTRKEEKMDDEDEDVAGIGNPGTISLVKWF